MEGPKAFAEKPQHNENAESVESLEESIERAREVQAELKKFDGVEVFGGDAMEQHAEAEALAAELKALLEKIPAKDCLEKGLPYHPMDKKPEGKVVPFPKEPDYPLPYKHRSSGDDYPRVGAEQLAA